MIWRLILTALLLVASPALAQVNQLTLTGVGGPASAPPSSPWTLIDSQSNQSAVGTTVTVNMTGANLIEVSLATSTGVGGTVTDSLGNTYTQIADTNNVNTEGYLFYCIPSMTGSAVIITAALSQGFAVEVWNDSSGTPSLDTFNTAPGFSGVQGSTQTGSITTTAGELAVTNVAYANGAGDPGGPLTIDSGFTIPANGQQTFTGAGGVGIAHLEPATATSYNPTWTWPNAVGIGGGIIASFLP